MAASRGRSASDPVRNVSLSPNQLYDFSRQPLFTSSASSAIYTPLDELNKELRLLSILPGKADPLECELKTFSLLAPEEEKHGVPPVPPFEAFSYEWGVEGSTHKIIILEGQNFPVRKNLWTALQHIRSASEKLIFWIDALCVNQFDFRERSHQVGLMEMIYTRADRVRVWLGPETKESGSAFDLLDKIHREVEIAKAKEHSSPVTPLSDVSPSTIAKGNGFGWMAFLSLWHAESSAREESIPNTNGTGIDEIHSLRRHISDHKTRRRVDVIMVALLDKLEAWTALQHLLCRTYWSRIWIVQEFVLARTITLHCGFHSVDWPVFETALSQIMQFKVEKYPELEHTNWPIVLNKIQHSPGSKIANMRIRGRGNQSLLELFEACKDSRCCDPRDRVYALLGLANDVRKYVILVDYTRSIVKVRDDVMKFFLRRQKSIRLDMDYIASLLLIMLESPQKFDQQQINSRLHGPRKPENRSFLSTECP